MSQPLVSAIVTTKNRAALLPRALESVFAQTYPNIELVVVDDGSTDDTQQVIEDFSKEHPILIIRNNDSMGAPGARNQGIEAASGEFVAGLDDDDEWHPERISYLMAANREDFACITSDVNLVYPSRERVWKKDRLFTFNDLLYSNQVGNQVLVKKERIMEVGGFDERLQAAQDYDLWLRLCKRYGPIRNVQEPLQNVYMDHGEEQITNPKTQLSGYLSFYQKHKSEMNYAQRKYQLFTIRRAQGKVEGVNEIFSWVPPSRWLKELKRKVASKYL